MYALFQRCQPAPEVGLGRASADEQESTNDMFQLYVKPQKLQLVTVLGAYYYDFGRSML